MKCSSCGSEFADGAKFCGECGAKVAVKKSAPIIDWSTDSIGANDLSAILSDEALKLLVFEIKQEIQKRSAPDRVLVRGDKGFDEKIDNFISELKARIGKSRQVNDIHEGAVAIFDCSGNGCGKRGFVFSVNAVYNISNTTPIPDDGKCITGRIPWKIFFKFATSVKGESFWQIKMSEILASEEVDSAVKNQIKKSDHVEKMFFVRSDTGLEWSFMAHELSRLKEVISGRDGTAINPQDICGIFRRLKSQLRTKRIFFNDDESFEMKCDTLLSSAVSVIQEMSVDKHGFSVMDRTVRFEGDKPRNIKVGKDDYLVLLDNSKAGFFGGVDNRPCLSGGLVTRKGILAYNCFDGKKGCDSGFVPWHLIAMRLNFSYGMRLFYSSPFKPYPKGDQIFLILDRVGRKDQYRDYYDETIVRLWHLTRQIKKPLDIDWYIGADPMGDAEEGDPMGDAEEGDPMGDAEEGDPMGDAEEGDPMGE